MICLHVNIDDHSITPCFINNLLPLLLFFLFSGLFGQQPEQSNFNVYQTVYETALRDSIIDDKEQSLLNTLQTTLGLTQEEISQIEIQFQDTRLAEDIIPDLTAPILDQSGRWPLVMQNMIYGASMYGWMVPYVLDAKDPKWYIGSEMLSLSAMFYLTYKYTKIMNIPHARAQMMRYGSVVGLAYGNGFNTVFDLGFSLFNDDSNESKTGAWILMLSVPAGIYVGDKLYNRWQPSHGQTWSLAMWSEIGSFTTRGLHNIIETRPEKPDRWEYEYWDTETQAWEIDDDDYYKKRKKYRPWKKRHTIVDLAGYPIGLYLGHRFFSEKQYSFGDALMLYQGRGLGLMYSAILGDLADMDFESSSARLLRMAGTITGPLLMDRFISGYDYTFGQAILSVLGTSSGLAFGIGTAAILEVDEPKVFELMMVGGSLAGLYIVNSILNLATENEATTMNNHTSFAIYPSFQVNNRALRKSSLATIIPAIGVDVRF